MCSQFGLIINLTVIAVLVWMFWVGNGTQASLMKGYPVLSDQRKVTVAQFAEKVNSGLYRKMWTTSRLQLSANGDAAVRVFMLISVRFGYLSWYWAKAGYTLDRSPQHWHLKKTPLGNLESPVATIDLTCMSLNCGRKPVYPEGTHADTRR